MQTASLELVTPAKTIDNCTFGLSIVMKLIRFFHKMPCFKYAKDYSVSYVIRIFEFSE